MNTLNSVFIKKEYLSVYVNEIAEKLLKQINFNSKIYIKQGKNIKFY